VNQTYLRLTTTYKDDVRSDLDIRPLNDTKDTISIPALEACIVDGQLVCSVENVTVSGVTVDVSGQTVDIEGQTVKSQIYDYNNYAITSQLVGSKRGLDVNNIGTVRAYEGAVIKEVGAFTDSHNKDSVIKYDYTSKNGHVYFYEGFNNSEQYTWETGNWCFNPCTLKKAVSVETAFFY
jgi:hypothetical protein